LTASSQQPPVRDDTFLYSALNITRVDHDIVKAEAPFLSREDLSLSPVTRQVELALQTRVRLLASFRNVPSWSEPTSLPPTPGSGVPVNACLVDISRHFCLNHKQHKVFTRVGAGFLHSILLEPHQTPDQIIVFLGGGPGTRKIQVIRALQGVAAEDADGQMIHSLYKWRVQRGAHTKRDSADEQRQICSFETTHHGRGLDYRRQEYRDD